MYKSRWVGIVAALSLVFCIVYEMDRFFSALSFAGESVSTIAIRNQLILQNFAVAVGIIALWRVNILAWSRSHSYAWQVLNWWLLAIALSIYMWMAAPSVPTAVCDGNGICFGIYDMRDYTNYVAIGGASFILLSFFRLLITLGLNFTTKSTK